jgi:diguanylate cyclase (GGDEF)-like protein
MKLDAPNPMATAPLSWTPAPETGGENDEAGRMQEEIDRLHRALSDSQNALLTSNEHGDLLQDHLHRLSTSLAAEIRERQKADGKLQSLLDAVTRERGDLEVLVQILMDEGDSYAEEGEKARIDGLTGIPNRRRLDEFLLKEWDRHKKLQQPLSFLLCDVDYFKCFNDLYGHQAGDECLKKVVKEIKASLRSDDLLARYGGEEFAIVLPHTPAQRAIQIAERVRAAVFAAAIPHGDSKVCGQVTLSIGVACQLQQPQDAACVRTLVEQSDRSLHIAKRLGRNRVEMGQTENHQ